VGRFWVGPLLIFVSIFARVLAQIEG